MKIFIAADHRGFQLKENLKTWLQTQGHDVEDCGNTQLDPLDDYVDFTRTAVKNLINDQKSSSQSPILQSAALAICGSGIGVSIAANRSYTIRCALCMTPEHARHARKNDHANMLALASDYISLETAQEIITVFLSTQESQDEKYIQRTLKLDKPIS